MADHLIPEPSFNADLYEDRLRLLELLGNTYPLPSRYPDPMAGIRIQTDWQRTSGRGAIPWWSKCNYCLTIWRLEALQDRGEFPGVRITGVRQVPLPKAMRRQLQRYYDSIIAINKGVKISPTLLQALLWTIHARTLNIGMRAARDVVGSLPPGEREFALGWGTIIVRTLASVKFWTTKHLVIPLSATLPARVCTAEDLDASKVTDLPLMQRTTACEVAYLYRAARYSGFYIPFLAFAAKIAEWLMTAQIALSRKSPLSR